MLADTPVRRGRCSAKRGRIPRCRNNHFYPASLSGSNRFPFTVFHDTVWLAASCAALGLSRRRLVSCFTRDHRHKALSGQLRCARPTIQDAWTAIGARFTRSKRSRYTRCSRIAMGLRTVDTCGNRGLRRSDAQDFGQQYFGLARTYRVWPRLDWGRCR